MADPGFEARLRRRARVIGHLTPALLLPFTHPLASSPWPCGMLAKAKATAFFLFFFSLCRVSLARTRSWFGVETAPSIDTDGQKKHSVTIRRRNPSSKASLALDSKAPSCELRLGDKKAGKNNFVREFFCPFPFFVLSAGYLQFLLPSE